jgi:predicted RNase H-like HicB family nuclease
MSVRPKSSESGSAKSDPRRPVRRTTLHNAAAIAERYQIVLWKEDGYYYGRGVELPHASGGGKTVEACVAETREALVATVATLLEDGDEPPPPAVEEQRTEQVNIRLTAREKLQLEAVAKQKGFRGVSDYVRSAVLEG